MPACEALRVEAVFANRAESSWVFFSGFPPSDPSAPPSLIQEQPPSPAVGGLQEHALTCCTG